MAVIHHARDIALHHGTPQLLVADFLSDCRFHQMRSGEKDGTLTLDDVSLVTHDG